MSFYRQGWNVGADTSQRWETENTLLQKELQERVRTFPQQFTWREAADTLAAAWQYGLQKRSRYGSADVLDLFLGRPVDVSGLTRAIDNAQVKERFWRAKATLINKPYVYKKGANKEWQELYSDVIKVYVEAAGVIGQRIVKDDAKQDLARDLNPIAPANIAKILGIAAICVGGLFGLQKLLQKS